MRDYHCEAHVVSTCCRKLKNASAAYDNEEETLNGHLTLLEGHEKLVILPVKKNPVYLLESQINLLKVTKSLSYGGLIKIPKCYFLLAVCSSLFDIL